MSIGRTFAAVDALTYFEEQLLSPIQPVGRVFTLYGTGLYANVILNRVRLLSFYIS